MLIKADQQDYNIIVSSGTALWAMVW